MHAYELDEAEMCTCHVNADKKNQEHACEPLRRLPRVMHVNVAYMKIGTIRLRAASRLDSWRILESLYCRRRHIALVVDLPPARYYFVVESPNLSPYMFVTAASTIFLGISRCM